MNSDMPKDDFVELIVPGLQKRGRFRKKYSGKMLCDHLNE